MVFDIQISKSSVEDIDSYVRLIRQDSRTRAEKWKGTLFEAISSLSSFPNRYSVIRENDQFELDYRQFMHHSHRVIYRIDEKDNVVYVVRVYHGARRELSARDLSENLN
jgi:plasmid stabilization system protein ParE